MAYDPRRRLSVNTGPGNGGGPSASVMEQEDRGLIALLDTQSLLDLLAPASASESQGRPNANARRGSCVMAEMEGRGVESFACKRVEAVGERLDARGAGIGSTCRKGLKPESPNQDSFFVLKMPGDFSIYSVLDGHGEAGHEVSNFAKENLPKLILQDPRFGSRTDLRGLCTDAFVKLQSLIATADSMRRFQAQNSGSTATIVIHDHSTDAICVAHVGDCTATLCRWKDRSRRKLVGTALTRDHKPDLKDERARIESRGGRVVFDGYANHRVYAGNASYPGLNMSRALGDLVAHREAGVCADPEICERRIGPADHVLIICSDGVWEFITPQEAADIVGGYTSDRSQAAADALAKEAWDRWIREENGEVVDDITVLIVYLPEDSPGRVAPFNGSRGAEDPYSDRGAEDSAPFNDEEGPVTAVCPKWCGC